MGPATVMKQEHDADIPEFLSHPDMSQRPQEICQLYETPYSGGLFLGRWPSKGSNKIWGATGSRGLGVVPEISSLVSFDCPDFLLFSCWMFITMTITRYSTTCGKIFKAWEVHQTNPTKAAVFPRGIKGWENRGITSNKRLQSFVAPMITAVLHGPAEEKKRHAGDKTPWNWRSLTEMSESEKVHCIYRRMVLNLTSKVPLAIMAQARSRSTRPRDSTAGEIQLMKIFEGILGTKLLARKGEPCFFVSFQQRCFWWNKILHLSQLGPWNTSILETIFKTCSAKRWYSMVLSYDE